MEEYPEPALEFRMKIRRSAGVNGRISRVQRALSRVVPPDSGPFWGWIGMPLFFYIIGKCAYDIKPSGEDAQLRAEQELCCQRFERESV